MENKSTRLRKLLEQGEFLINIGVGTAQQAPMAEKVGFKMVAVSGAATSNPWVSQGKLNKAADLFVAFHLRPLKALQQERRVS